MGVADLRSSMSNFSLYIFLIQKTKIEIGMRDGSVAKGGDGCGQGGICTPKVYIKNQKSALLLIPASASLTPLLSSFSADFDWTLYLGLAFITAVCFAFGAALICCARRGIRANPHYNMARSGKSSTRTRHLPHLTPPHATPAIAAIESLLTLPFYSYGCGLHARRCR